MKSLSSEGTKALTLVSDSGANALVHAFSGGGIGIGVKGVYGFRLRDTREPKPQTLNPKPQTLNRRTLKYPPKTGCIEGFVCTLSFRAHSGRWNHVYFHPL